MMDELVLAVWTAIVIFVWIKDPLCGIAIGSFLFWYLFDCVKDWFKTKKTVNNGSATKLFH